MIRIWEQRCHTVDPQRTPGNRRPYSDSDIGWHNLQRDVTHAGCSVGQVARLPMDKLGKLAVESPAIRGRAVGPITEAPPSVLLLNECVAAIKSLDAHAFDGALKHGAYALGTVGLPQCIVAPLTQTIFAEWDPPRRFVGVQLRSSHALWRVVSWCPSSQTTLSPGLTLIHAAAREAGTSSFVDFGYATWQACRVKQLQPPDLHHLPAANWRFALRLSSVLFMGLIGLSTGCRAPAPSPPEGVLKFEREVKLAGKEVAVDFYLPQALKKAPVVVVAHGFSRSRLNMAGWGGLLASNGFITAIPDLPAWSDHERNSHAIRELLHRINSKTLVTEPAPNGHAALMGFSMGGLCALLAAATNDQVRCWVGLDPVDASQKGAEAAKRLHIPCAVFQAEPSRCNGDGNAKQLVAGLPGPLFALRVRGATHTDPELPTDWLAELFCGKADAKRRAIFESYTLAVLKSVFFGDASALAALASATNDVGVKVLSTRAIKDFKP